MPQKKKIEWERVRIVVVPTDKPNPRNPHAVAGPKERAEGLQALARQILLRRSRGVEGN